MKQIEFLNHISEKHKKLFSTPIHLEADHQILNENDQCGHVLFLLSGKIQVYKLSENGKVFQLYTIMPGESCVLNLSCILSGSNYFAYAKAKTDIECVMVTRKDFMDLFNGEDSVKSYVFNLISHRLIEITSKVEGIVLGSLENRLKNLLLEERREFIYMTHEQIANDLGSAREVISRQLKKWEKQGKIELFRGKIHLIDL
jgi:CRP/FNR family transcriptional regulator